MEEDHQKVSKRGQIARSAYVAHLGSKDGFLSEFEQALGQASYQRLVIVADGASWIWQWAEREYPEAVQILDYYHAKQALWRYAQARFASRGKRLAWLSEQEERLFDNGVDEIIDEVAASNYRSLSELEERDRLRVYLENNRSRMAYGSYRRQGLMIGSGPIESAHRNVIQQRLKLAGQRWNRSGAQAILNLRVLSKSKHWSVLVQQASRLRQAA